MMRENIYSHTYKCSQCNSEHRIGFVCPLSDYCSHWCQNTMYLYVVK